MNSTTMTLHLGRLLFGIGIVLAIALSAPVPKWEFTKESLAPIAEKAKQAKLAVVVEKVDAESDKLAGEWKTRLSQVLLLQGVHVTERKKSDPAYAPLALKTTLGESSNTVALYAEGALEPIATATLLRDPKWPRTTTLWAMFAFVAAVGAGLWRYGVKLQAKQGLESASDEENPFALLARLLPPARTLGAELEALSEGEVTKRVDELLDTFVLPLAVVRQKVIDRLGMKDGSEILVVLAYGERMLNRVWSAASDGHLPEAHNCYPDALDALEEANRLAKAALGSTYTGTGGPSGAPVAASDGE